MAFADAFNQRFSAYLTPERDVPPRLTEAVQYSALAPGKRLRPYLVVRCCELVGGDRAHAWPVAAAVECIHAFSLIHDDLPAMDDDDLRRGRPTSHIQFGEAMAILAGDALVVQAFELLGRHVQDRPLAAELIHDLARAAGWSGMIGGQTADVLGEAEPPSLRLAEYIHHRKTAALFEVSCRMGARCGCGEPDRIARLSRFGQLLGRAFQIADDLLDVTANQAVMGKQVGKDAEVGKQTFPQCIGMEESQKAAREAVQTAAQELDPFGPAADDLRWVAEYTIDRNY